MSMLNQNIHPQSFGNYVSFMGIIVGGNQCEERCLKTSYYSQLINQEQTILLGKEEFLKRVGVYTLVRNLRLGGNWYINEINTRVRNVLRLVGNYIRTTFLILQHIKNYDLTLLMV